MEYNFESPILRSVRFCRRIVPDGNPIFDSCYREKLERSREGTGGRNDLILRRKNTQLPRGFMVVEEIQEGADVTGVVVRSRISPLPEGKRAVHVCNKQAPGRGGIVDGMAYRWVDGE